MEQKPIGRDLAKEVTKLNKTLSERFDAAVESGNTFIVDAVKALLTGPEEEVRGFVDRVHHIQSEQQKIPTFVVGKEFATGNQKAIFYHGDNFAKKCFQPAMERKVRVDACAGKVIKETELPRDMKDTAIQELAGKPGLMTEDQFWATVYNLTRKPKNGKKHLQYELAKDKVYIFHVQFDTQVFACYLRWNGDGWDLGAKGFDDWVDRFVAACSFLSLLPSSLSA